MSLLKFLAGAALLLMLASLILIGLRRRLKGGVVAIGAFCGAGGFGLLVAYDALKVFDEKQPFDSAKWISAVGYSLASLLLIGYEVYLLLRGTLLSKTAGKGRI